MTSETITITEGWGPSADRLGLPDAEVGLMWAVQKDQAGEPIVERQANGTILAVCRPTAVYSVNNNPSKSPTEFSYANGAKIVVDSVSASGISKSDMQSAALEVSLLDRATAEQTDVSEMVSTGELAIQVNSSRPDLLQGAFLPLGVNGRQLLDYARYTHANAAE